MDQLVKNAEHVDFVNVSVQEWIKTVSFFKLSFILHINDYVFSAVQHRRDAIGKYSAGVKRELSPDAEFEPSAKVSTVSEPSTSSGPSGGFNQNVSSPAGIPRVPSTLRTTQASTCMNSACGQKSVLHELICRQNFLTEQRQLFYAGCLGDWFRKPSSIENVCFNSIFKFKTIFNISANSLRTHRLLELHVSFMEDRTSTCCRFYEPKSISGSVANCREIKNLSKFCDNASIRRRALLDLEARWTRETMVRDAQ